jgi:hypothetical protein
MTSADTAVRRLSAAVSGSRLVQVCVRLIASIRTAPEVLPDRVVDADLSVLQGLFASSSLVAPMRKRWRRVVDALAGSRALRELAAWRTRRDSLARWQLLRALGIAGFVAVMIGGVLTLIDPRPISVYRWLLWAAAALVFAAAAAGARSFDAACSESRVLRHL